MKLTPDAKRRVVLPPPIQQGDFLLLDEQGQNRWLLTRAGQAKRATPRKLKGKSVADVLAASAGAEIHIAELKEQVHRVEL